MELILQPKEFLHPKILHTWERVFVQKQVNLRGSPPTGGSPDSHATGRIWLNGPPQMIWMDACLRKYEVGSVRKSKMEHFNIGDDIGVPTEW